jgi:hypothetical protein
MWCNGKNLDKPITGPDGTVWHFSAWSDSVQGTWVQRLFFWNEAKSETGLIEFRGPDTLHVRKIKQRLSRIAKDSGYRKKHLRPLRFPLKRYW